MLPMWLMDDVLEIIAYQQALEGIQCVVLQRQWDDLEGKTERLNLARYDLQVYLNHHDMNETLKHDLEQLSIKHRRVARQLNQQLHQTEDDLNQVNEGLRHIHRVQESLLNQ